MQPVYSMYRTGKQKKKRIKVRKIAGENGVHRRERERERP